LKDLVATLLTTLMIFLAFCAGHAVRIARPVRIPLSIKIDGFLLLAFCAPHDILFELR